MAKCNSCVHFYVCQKYNATVDFDVDDGVCLHYEKQAVRCKDCKKGHPELAPNGGVWCAVWNHVFNDDGFCSKGERKDNG